MTAAPPFLDASDAAAAEIDHVAADRMIYTHLRYLKPSFSVAGSAQTRTIGLHPAMRLSSDDANSILPKL